MRKLRGGGRRYYQVRVGDPPRGALAGISRSRDVAAAEAARVGGWVEPVNESRLIAVGLSPDDPDFAIRMK